ncbi:MAG: DASS family sodium-coupled anion symporter [Planctomycetes bacterium]|nr:DASS family sodium-coupled anion symporter [Planctomycetota bacterium]
MSFEERFDLLRRRVGLVLAPLLFAFILSADFESLADKPAAHRLAAVMSAVVVLWVTEAIPMPLTALLGATACVLLQVAPEKPNPPLSPTSPVNVVFGPYADQLMFLFIGSFMLARAIELHQLDRRLALSVLTLRAVGGSPSRLLFAFGAVTAFISAWISNTATTAMMFAIGLSILKVLRDDGKGQIDPRFATGMMLMTSFSASIGGLATPIGTPPNVIGLKAISLNVPGVEVTFFEWCLIGVPVVVLLYLFLFAYLNWFCPAGVKELAGGREYLLRQRAELGPWTRGQISTLIAFSVMVVLWIAPGVIALSLGEKSAAYRWCKISLPEAVPALLGAGLLFLLPGRKGRAVLTWPEATQIDWGVVLLYGGGFAFGTLAQETGLADVIGKNMIGWLPNAGTFSFLIAATLVATLVSEATSNTASANIVVPVVITMATAAGVDPLEPALGATLGCSLGFMLPVSTPCNAIVYGSGMVPLSRMIRYGVLLDIAGTIFIVAVVKVLGGLVR